MYSWKYFLLPKRKWTKKSKARKVIFEDENVGGLQPHVAPSSGWLTKQGLASQVDRGKRPLSSLNNLASITSAHHHH